MIVEKVQVQRRVKTFGNFLPKMNETITVKKKLKLVKYVEKEMQNIQSATKMKTFTQSKYMIVFTETCKKMNLPYFILALPHTFVMN